MVARYQPLLASSGSSLKRFFSGWKSHRNWKKKSDPKSHGTQREKIGTILLLGNVFGRLIFNISGTNLKPCFQQWEPLLDAVLSMGNPEFSRCPICVGPTKRIKKCWSTRLVQPCWLLQIRRAPPDSTALPKKESYGFKVSNIDFEKMPIKKRKANPPLKRTAPFFMPLISNPHDVSLWMVGSLRLGEDL